MLVTKTENKIPYPAPVDPAKYAPGLSEPETFYGLPREIRFCARCGYSNQKPNSEKEFKHNINTRKPTVEFDEQGVCAACRVADLKKNIDWSERKRQLMELCDRYRRSDGHYDCLVPGSGGKDSFYAAHKLKYEFGMNPLTVTWAPHIYTDWGWQNFQAWIHAGFDNYLAAGWEDDRVAILRSIQDTPFFQTVRGGLVTGLYNQKDIWPIFGYEGESFSQGGYIDRGFDDIDWL